MMHVGGPDADRTSGFVGVSLAPSRTFERRKPTTTLRLTVTVLVVAALLTISPLWFPLIMATWTAILVHPFFAKVAIRLRGRHRGAALVTVLLVLGLVLPIAFVSASVVVEVVDLVGRLKTSASGRAALSAIVSNGDGGLSFGRLDHMDLSKAAALVRAHGASALQTVSAVAGATANAVVGMFVFVLGTYVLLLHGKAAYGWLLNNAPLHRNDTERLAAAFAETGRGLFFGVAVTALLQGGIATIGYFAFGLPQAAALGALTVMAAFIPSFGAGLVWAPVTLGLWLAQRHGAAIAIFAIGMFVSTADNFVRPALSRHGKLDLPMFVVFVAMLGGVMFFGTWDILLGPLLVRLAEEGLRLLRQQPRRGFDDITPASREPTHPGAAPGQPALR